MQFKFDVHVQAPQEIKVDATVTVDVTVEEFNAQLKAGTENLKEVTTLIKDIAPKIQEIFFDIAAAKSKAAAA
jgi:uncharacterized protein YqfB (UPF0267 family)